MILPLASESFHEREKDRDTHGENARPIGLNPPGSSKTSVSSINPTRPLGAKPSPSPKSVGRLFVQLTILGPKSTSPLTGAQCHVEAHHSLDNCSSETQSTLPICPGPVQEYISTPPASFPPIHNNPSQILISPGKISDRQVPPPPPIPEGPPLSVGRRPGPSRLAEPSGPPARAEGGLGRNAGGGGSISKCLGACQARSGRG